MIGTCRESLPALEWEYVYTGRAWYLFSGSPHLHNFNVCISEQGSLGMRLGKPGKEVVANKH